MEKMSLYKFTHIPLFKNDAQLKQKSDKQAKKKKINHLNLLKNKNHVKKKKTRLFKKKKITITPCTRKSKEKIE